jgi:hypothetical protein
MLGSHSASAFLGEYYRCWRPALGVPCPLCLGRGLQECTVLHGVENVPERDAFDFAFGRLQKNVLVDASKDLDWISSFCRQQQTFNVKAVHLIRDPRGFYFSQRRRIPEATWPSLMSRWVQQNCEIDDFLKQHNITSTTAFYDDLASRPLEAFPSLFEALGLEPESPTVNYWERDHHAYSANGASYRLLRENPVSFFITGDDRFYAAQEDGSFHDQRWQSGLGQAEKQTIERNVDIAGLLSRHGRRMEAEGLQAC